MTLCRFEQVSKWYGPVIGLNDVSLELGPGITGLVGHNGAGKSTMLKLMTGQLRPSIGQVRIQGRRAWSAAAKRYVGYCPDVDSFYEEMSGRAFIDIMAKLHGFGSRAAKTRTEEVLEQVGMADRADRPLGSYSKGMRQRIKLGQALVHNPDMIVLDEPLNGVDPVGRADLIQLFRDLKRAGKALLVSSHLLDEMDTLADRILFICRGRILADGTLGEIRDRLDEHPLKIRINAEGARKLAAHLMAFETVQSVELNADDELLLEVNRAKTFYRAFNEFVAEQGVSLERLQVIDASTEAVFDYLMESANHPK